MASFGQWLLDAAQTPLGGVIIGASAALAGGLGGAGLLSLFEDRRAAAHALTAHKAAVRAVVYELVTNRTNLIVVERQNALRGLAVYDHAFRQSLAPLFSKLPEDLATNLAHAYALTALLRDTHEFGLVKQALAATETARVELRRYARVTLGLFGGRNAEELPDDTEAMPR